MASNGTSRRLQPVYFRVLIIGRANAGKTSILQRVCDTTQSPKVYRKTSGAYLNPYRNREEVQLEPTAERGQHNINDELIFPNYDHYIFHDSCGLECGKKGELTVIQDFVQEKAKENRLDDRLHAIWYCIPMDNLRPSLDLKYFHDICPDKNVPIIAVFTKYDQFKFNVKINLEDDEQQGPSLELIEEKAEKLFQAHYLGGIAGPLRHVRLERMQEPGRHCQVLIEETANALTDGRVALMLLGIQRGNLRMAISMGLRWTSERIHEEKIMGVQIVNSCMYYFPPLWVSSFFAGVRNFS